eukprot:CFRG0307T1
MPVRTIDTLTHTLSSVRRVPSLGNTGKRYNYHTSETKPKQCYRSHTCGELRASDASSSVTLSGWIVTKREFGSDLRFLPLRDAYGITQLTYSKSSCPSHVWDLLESATIESIVKVTGTVRLRPDGQANKAMLTGEIEVAINNAELLGPCKTMPFPLDDNNVGASMSGLRMEHRYLALRSSVLQKNIRMRAQIAKSVRSLLENECFTEIETPLLFRRTPEGAREFVVPSRSTGKFYALPQSPQQYKQLLMVAGFDRYYQFARCFRDEDLRADRQPEFTQIDVEMSFVTMRDVMDMGEKLCRRMWETAGLPISPAPFRVMSFSEAMDSYGCDKPDTRFDMKLHTIDDAFKNTNASFLRETALNTTQSIVAFNLGKAGEYMTNRELNTLQTVAKEAGCDTASFIQIKGGTIASPLNEDCVWKSSIAKFLDKDAKAKLVESLGIRVGDTVILGCGRKTHVRQAMGKVRLQCATTLEDKGVELRTKTGASSRFEFLWVVDFPLFTAENDDNPSMVGPTHHPFTAPVVADENKLGTADMMQMRGQHFDLVVNGVELGGGSMRMHSAEMQRRILVECLKVDPANFEHLLAALHSGCPPHGGFAFGFDRVMALITDSSSLRDVIAFPKSFSGKEPMTGSPCELTASELAVYHLQIT